MLTPRRILHVLALLAAASLTGCVFVSVDENPRFDETNFRVRKPQSLALAPITNVTSVKDAGPKMRSELYGALATLRYDDVKIEHVDDVINEKAQQLNVPPEKVDPYYVADPALADAVVFAEIRKVSRFFLLIYSRIRIDVSLVMIDTSTRRYLYSNDFSVKNQIITAPTNPIEIFTSLFSTIWHLRDEELDESFRRTASEISKRFPNREPGATVGATSIAQVKVVVPGPTLHTSDRVLLEVQGTPKRKASFSIGSIAKDSPMQETAAGTYSGLYVVKQGDDARYLYATVTLANPAVEKERAVLAASGQSFAIDTIPPPTYAVQGWTRESGKPGIVLHLKPESGLEPPTQSRPAAFHIYRGGAGQALVYIGTTKTADYSDQTAQDGVEYEYGVVTESASGNLSQPHSRALIRPTAASAKSSN